MNITFEDATELKHLHAHRGLRIPFLYKEQKRIIDEWMQMNGFPVLNYGQIEELFGGFGDNRPKTMEDLDSRPKAMATRWFDEGQSWYDYYGSPQYVYDNWWCAWNVSRTTYAAAARIFEPDSAIYDVGGTIFSASLFRECSPTESYVYRIHNFNETVAFSFYKFYKEWYYENYQIDMNILAMGDVWGQSTSVSRPRYGSLCGIFAEYFEHFKNVDEEFKRWTHLDQMVVANGFCVPAYGHHIPIKVNNKLCTTRDEADYEFRQLAARHGYQIAKVRDIAKNVLHLRRD